MDQASETARSKVTRVTVAVTSAQIDQAIPQDSAHCMIADAIKATVPHAKAVSVDLASIRWTDPRVGKRYLYLTPPSVQEALLLFDNGIKPPPFRFVLRSPAQIATAGTEANNRGARANRGVEMVVPGEKLPAKIGGVLPGLGPLTNSPRARVDQQPPVAPLEQQEQPAPSISSEPAAAPKRQKRAERFPDQTNRVLQGRRRSFGLRQMARVHETLRAQSEQVTHD